MSDKTSSQKHAELKKLGKDARKNLFQMLSLASDILADPEYVDQFGGEGPLLDHLEETDFSHFGGRPSLASMLRAYRANPNENTWREYRHNIHALIDLAAPDKQKNETERTDWKSLAKELQVRVQMLEAQVSESQATNAKLQQQIGELRGRFNAMTIA